MDFGLAPVFSQSEDPQKAEQTSLSPSTDLWAVSSCVCAVALLSSLLGLTWGLKEAGSPLESPLMLFSLFVLWGTVVLSLVLMVFRHTLFLVPLPLSRESLHFKSKCVDADLVRGSSQLPPRYRAILARMEERKT
jgi:hypothetical protein